jgi:RNA polymerase sigma-70 factor (ECF subfamily)
MAGTREPAETRAIDRFLSSRTDESFSGLFHIVYPRMRRYLLFRGFTVEISEELAQDVLLTVYRKAATIRDQALFHPWLFKVAQNVLRQHLRSIKNDPGCEPLVEVAVHGRVLENEGFLDLIRVLPEDERQVMMLRYIDELNYDEIASVLDMPIGTVKWKIFDSKARIQAHLRQHV